MQPVITVFKTESLTLSALYDQLGILPHEAKECEFFYTYGPPPGKLSEVLETLRRNKVNHGIQFVAVRAPRSRKAIKSFSREVVAI